MRNPKNRPRNWAPSVAAGSTDLGLSSRNSAAGSTDLGLSPRNSAAGSTDLGLSPRNSAAGSTDLGREDGYMKTICFYINTNYHELVMN